MSKFTLNLAPRLIHTKNLNFEGDKLTVVDCIPQGLFKFLAIVSAPPCQLEQPFSFNETVVCARDVHDHIKSFTMFKGTFLFTLSMRLLN